MYLLTLGLFAGTILLIFALKYLSSIFSTRAQVVEREHYLKLAEDATAVNERLARELATVRADLAGIKERTAEIQHVLQQVE
ncbi:hypothetical protein [Deinococcus sonorensis]|uniref:DNA recombination protein RmuC n=2 Tax=Deinococcus sonorensis TaxID=309891 RepID=A0AAU7U6H6_9DEIO